MPAGRHIICFGNALHGDDGFGPYVYERLREHAWPDDVRLFNAAVAGLDALPWLEDCRVAILVDALAGGGRPGTVRLFRPEQIDSPQADLSGHAAGVPYLLRAAAALHGTAPEILVVGAEVEAVTPFAPGLTPALRRAAERVARLIRRRLIGVGP
ncbi:hydrogenase maturation protease [Methylogaea oryzae]|uniref:Hydrogenase maturation protease n=1 Tax=Methylogaea oryzae TaxID=1295382 RepID=A0A8D5AGA3_9GAMM|nr:hydrogenase maturation protease [Methylogaea oryzae]BBL70183.1 hypothetical protein MoryE10_07890 [Methylogaea oryzae]